MRIVIALALVLEGLSSGVTAVGRLPSLAVYPALTLGLLALRGVVGVVQFASGWMLARNQPPGAHFARGVLLASACLLTLELGFDLTPNSVFHTYRWPAVGLYWVYAVVGIALLRKGRKEVRSTK